MESLGEFTIEAILGEGAIARVYQARQGPGSEPCALKVLKEEFLNRDAYCDHFRYESTLAQSFAHPHLVPCFSYGEAGGFMYQHYPLLSGGDVQQALRESPQRRLPLGHSLRLGEHMSSAIHRLSQLNVIHRDIKPGNILIDSYGNFCLADFGLAISNGRMPPDELPQGTLAYCSPEQLRSSGDLDSRSDIYCLGITLYRCLSGVLPFPQIDRDELLGAILRGAKEPLASVCPDIPLELAQLVDSCCAQDREKRPADARALMNVFASMSREVVVPAFPMKQPRFGLRFGSCPQGGMIEVAPYARMEQIHDPMLRAIQPAHCDDIMHVVYAEACRVRPWTRRIIIPKRSYIPSGWGSNDTWSLIHHTDGIGVVAVLKKGAQSTKEQRQQLAQLLTTHARSLPTPSRLVELIAASEQYTEAQFKVANGSLPVPAQASGWTLFSHQRPKHVTRQGEVIGKWKDGHGETLGSDAYGSAIRPLQRQSAQYTSRLGEGVSEQYSTTPHLLLAQQNGYIQHCLDGLIQVLPCTEMNQDELQANATIRSEECLIIQGNIPEGMRIFSKLGVVINGRVGHCVIESLGDIHIRGNVHGAGTKIISGSGIYIDGDVYGSRLGALDILCTQKLFYADCDAQKSLLSDRIIGGVARCSGRLSCNVAGSYFGETTALMLSTTSSIHHNPRIAQLHEQCLQMRMQRLRKFEQQLSHSYQSMLERSRRFHREASDAITDMRKSLKRLQAIIAGGDQEDGPLRPQLCIERLVYSGVTVTRGPEPLQAIHHSIPPDQQRASCDGGLRGPLTISSDDQGQVL